MESANYLQKVKDQYEDYPYPERYPEDEKKRLFPPKVNCLDQINYYCFEGKRDIRTNARVLIAGGGTGDSAIFIAEQLRGFDAEVVYLDISRASMEVAQQRAAIRGLDQITWLHGSLLDLPTMELGTFDYIDCSGVLHHLASPPEGLAALNSVLRDTGAMAIMVYARYGRTAVYHIQELMRRINRDETNMQIKVENCKKVLDNLPDTNWFRHLTYLFPHWEFKKPIELYDLFLHSQDRAYSIPQLYEFIEAEGLKILHMLPEGSLHGNNLYEPSSYLDDAGLIGNINKLPRRDQQAIAELLNGGIPTHAFYVAKDERPSPSLSDRSNIPFLNIYWDTDAYSSLYSIVQRSKDVITIKEHVYNTSISFPKTPNCEGIFRYLDGNKSLETIFRKIIASPKYRKGRPTMPVLQEEFKTIYNAFSVLDIMFLRGEHVPYPATVLQMQRRVAQT